MGWEDHDTPREMRGVEATGIGRRPEETPREYLRRVCEAVGCDQAQTKTVIETAEAALFGLGDIEPSCARPGLE